jgi:cell wall-associated NlpC family hydrolase
MIKPLAKDIIDSAVSYLGTPFRHQGRFPGNGLDCVGVIVCSAKAAGLEPDDVTHYPSEPDGVRLLSELSRRLVEVKDEWRPADVLLMRYYRDPRHLALWTGEHIVHADNVTKRVIMHGIDNRHIRQIVSAWRFPELI